jgi:3-methyladenine DNA glycosylase AlkD
MTSRKSKLYDSSLKELVAELRKTFSRLGNPQVAKEQQRYMKSEMPFWGLKAPQLKKICPPIFKKYTPQSNEDYRNSVLYIFKHAIRREEWYVGFIFATKFKKYVTEKNVDLYIKLVRLTEWWDAVDGIASNLIGPALLGSTNLKAFLKSWIRDDNMWVRRTALLTQLKYKDRTDFTLLSSMIKETWHEQDFFIRKAIGWALRQYSYSDSEKVIEFIYNNNDDLSKLSVTEGLKALKRRGVIA